MIISLIPFPNLAVVCYFFNLLCCPLAPKLDHLIRRPNSPLTLAKKLIFYCELVNQKLKSLTIRFTKAKSVNIEIFFPQSLVFRTFSPSIDLPEHDCRIFNSFH